MGRLKGENIAFFSKHIEQFDKAYQKQIYFCFDTPSNGEAMFKVLRNTYGDGFKNCNYGADYRDFYMVFNDGGARTWVYDDINSSLVAYRLAHGNDVVEDPENTTVSDVEVTKSGSSTTYIIIGVAAVAVILIMLLWDRKRK